jgi:NTP pyrophosphatase (non-canonical NTP hydrolase)
MPTDSERSIADLKAAVKAFADERDWLQFHSPKNLSMAIAAESGELLEHFLWMESEASRGALEDDAKRQAVADELADIIIYCVQFANVTDIDLADAIAAKMQQNAHKYPVEKSKGRSDKYTEL